MTYISINNYSRIGKMGISLDAITTLAYNAVKEIPGAKIYDPSVTEKKTKSKSKTAVVFSVPSGLKVSLSADGKAIIKLDIIIKEGAPVSETCLSIQKAVNEALHLACDSLTCDIFIKVLKIA